MANSLCDKNACDKDVHSKDAYGANTEHISLSLSPSLNLSPMDSVSLENTHTAP